MTQNTKDIIAMGKHDLRTYRNGLAYSVATVAGVAHMGASMLEYIGVDATDTVRESASKGYNAPIDAYGKLVEMIGVQTPGSDLTDAEAQVMADKVIELKTLGLDYDTCVNGALKWVLAQRK